MPESPGWIIRKKGSSRPKNTVFSKVWGEANLASLYQKRYDTYIEAELVASQLSNCGKGTFVVNRPLGWSKTEKSL